MRFKCKRQEAYILWIFLAPGDCEPPFLILSQRGNRFARAGPAALLVKWQRQMYNLHCAECAQLQIHYKYKYKYNMVW